LFQFALSCLSVTFLLCNREQYEDKDQSSTLLLYAAVNNCHFVFEFSKLKALVDDEAKDNIMADKNIEKLTLAASIVN